MTVDSFLPLSSGTIKSLTPIKKTFFNYSLRHHPFLITSLLLISLFHTCLYVSGGISGIFNGLGVTFVFPE